MSERWAVDNLALVVHPPWRTSDQDPNMDGEAIDVRKMNMPEEPKGRCLLPLSDDAPSWRLPAKWCLHVAQPVG